MLNSAMWRPQKRSHSSQEHRTVGCGDWHYTMARSNDSTARAQTLHKPPALAIRFSNWQSQCVTRAGARHEAFLNVSWWVIPSMAPCLHRGTDAVLLISGRFNGRCGTYFHMSVILQVLSLANLSLHHLDHGSQTLYDEGNQL